MTVRDKLDISKYFVVGPENVKGHSVTDVIRAVVEAGFTCLQIRSKSISAQELIQLTGKAADVILEAGKSDKVILLVNDRLDVVLAALEQRIKVDGIHVGQSDIPVDVCRKYLGKDAVIGLSARTHELSAYIQTADVSQIDYFGIGPLRETETKPDCGLGLDGKVITRSLEEIKKLAELSPVPLVVGGGVKLLDIPLLVQTGVGGFFVVTAVSEARDPKTSAIELVNAWKAKGK